MTSRSSELLAERRIRALAITPELVNQVLAKLGADGLPPACSCGQQPNCGPLNGWLQSLKAGRQEVIDGETLVHTLDGLPDDAEFVAEQAFRSVLHYAVMIPVVSETYEPIPINQVIPYCEYVTVRTEHRPVHPG